MSLNKTLAPVESAGTMITEAQRADFAARVRQNTKDASKRQTWDILSVMPHDRAVTLTVDLWRRCEPLRRRREQAFRNYLLVFAVLFVGMLLSFLFLAITHFSEKTPLWFIIYQLVVQTSIFFGNHFMRDRVVTPEQSGCILLLSALKEARLTPAMVDALGGRWLDAPSDYRTALRQELAVLLPEYARSDYPPLDTYQQNVLRREIKLYTRRLRKPGTSVPHREAEFIVAAVRYLTGLQASDTACEKNRTLIKQAAALPPAELETPTRCAVREAATACLPLVRTARH